MPFLSIAGIEVDVSTEGATQTEGIIVGDKRRAFDGTLRTTRRATKRAWKVTGAVLTQAQETALRTATANLLPVTITGDFVNNVPFTGIVEISDSAFVANGVGFLRSPAISIEEA